MSTDNWSATRVFLSYSRRDSWFVALYRMVLRSVGVKVWFDRESIDPGRRWSVAVAEGVHECGRMLVFWCHHASRSKEVKREYTMALEQNKVVVPIVMDRTALPAALSELHYEDVRQFTWWSHDVVKVGVMCAVLGAICVAVGWWLGGRP